MLSDKWFTAIAQNDDDTFTFISGRSAIDDILAQRRHGERIEVTWTYKADAKGLPADDGEAQTMEEVEEVLRRAMEKDKLAILTGIYTGQGQRQWIYVTKSSELFGRRLNRTLAAYPLLPISIYAERDEDNNEYRELLDLRTVDD